ANPLLLPRLRLPARDVWVLRAHALPAAAAAAAGTVTSVDADALELACGEGVLRIEAMCCERGGALDPASLGLRAGQRLPAVEAPSRALAEAVARAASGEREAIATLRAIEPFALPFAAPAQAGGA